MSITVHSEFGKLQSLFIKKAASAFINDQHLEKEWRHLNYLGKPDFNKAVSEYETFESIIKEHSATVHYLTTNDTLITGFHLLPRRCCHCNK